MISSDLISQTHYSSLLLSVAFFLSLTLSLLPTTVLGNRVSSSSAIMLDDTDNGRALISSSNYSLNSPPNLTLFVLPTSGDYSISSSNYNSSLCAISSKWDSLSTSNDANIFQPLINQSETERGIISIPVKPGANLENVTQTLRNQRRFICVMRSLV